MNSIAQRTIQTIRVLAADMVEAAQSGHPGMPMGSASIAYVLWTKVLRYSPRNPAWLNRDRFVLSAGHGSSLLYALLYLTGYDMTLDDLKSFRQWGSRTPGHPEYGVTPGVEVTTGPLGQGFANGVGMAIAQKALAARFNREGFDLFNYRVFGIVGDGDLMEGISHEAASIAGHQHLGNLVYLYDDNRITIDGPTELAFSDDIMASFSALHWHVQEVDGDDPEAIEMALQAAIAEKDRPSLIKARTHIGNGAPTKHDSSAAHGAPLGTEELRGLKKHYGFDPDKSFIIPADVLEHMRTVGAERARFEEEWTRLLDRYEKEHPALAEEFTRPAVQYEFLDSMIPLAHGKPMATRKASGMALNEAAKYNPMLMGGSADLSSSNNVIIKGAPMFSPEARQGRHIHFGVREHAMAAITNGMSLSPPIIPYCGTFLVFSDYMRPAIRVAAMSGYPVIYIFSHDSIGVGEDGPTHQPVEQLAALRAIPNLVVLRPADANETLAAWQAALARRNGPTVLVTTRQSVPVFGTEMARKARNVKHGAYILEGHIDVTPDVVLIATGSEVHVALEAAKQLRPQGYEVRVVSMPSWELFEEQPEEYKRAVLPSEIPNRVIVEAGIRQGWERYGGQAGRYVTMDTFGASAPGEVLYEKFHITAERVVREVRDLLGTPAPTQAAN